MKPLNPRKMGTHERVDKLMDNLLTRLDVELRQTELDPTTAEIIMNLHRLVHIPEGIQVGMVNKTDLPEGLVEELNNFFLKNNRGEK